MKRAKGLVIFFLLLVIALATFEQISQNESQASSTNMQPSRWSDEITVHAAGRGNPWISVADGKEIFLETQGSSAAVKALQDGGSSSLSAATADFDEDGMPDLVMGHKVGSTGAISFLRGNVDSVYPNTREAKERIARGVFTSAPFLGPARVISTYDLVPDFIVAGDFDADGHFDVAAARRGADSLSYFCGDGRGGFAFAKRVHLPGQVTAMIAEDFNRRDGMNDVIVGLSTRRSGKVLVFEHPYGAMKATPEVLDFASPVSSLGAGYLEGDARIDLAVAAGSELAIIRGRDRRLFIELSGASAERVNITQYRSEFEIASLAVGEFVKSEHYHHEVALLSTDGGLNIVENRGKKIDSVPSAEWRQTHDVALDMNSTASQAVMITSRVSARAVDTLVVADSGGIRLLTSDFLAPKANQAPEFGSQSFGIETVLDTTGSPTAILPMRLNVDALSDLVIVNELSLSPTIVQTGPMVTFTVNSAASDPDMNLGDGVCLTAVSTCTYYAAREEIAWTGSTMGLTTINFNIPGGGIPSIAVPSGFSVSAPGPYIVDGTTQPGTNLVEFTGVDPVVAAHNTVPFQDGHVFRGMIINGFNDFNSYFYLDRSNNCIVEGNRIGTNAAGTAVQSSASVNQGVATTGDANNSRVGGTVAAARNIISTGTGYGVYPGGFNVGSAVMGNYIGTDITGTVALGNRTNGVYTQGSETIGGTTTGAGNVIAGTTDDPNIPGLWANGITARGGEELSNLLIQGNLIGTNAAGSAALPNLQHGIEGNGPIGLIGGVSPPARNLISGNTFDGVNFTSTFSVSIVPQVTGNMIGANAAGPDAIPNGGWGVIMTSDVGSPSVITSNTIWNNTSGGVRLGDNNFSIHHRINQNSISNNGGFGIDIGPLGLTPNDNNDADGGSNRRQNFPVLTSLTAGGLISGTIDSTTTNAAYPMRIEFFANTACFQPSGHGQGEVYLGFVSVAAPGAFSHTLALIPAKPCVTATATDNVGNTSEFSLGILPPSAAGVSVSGRILTVNGHGIRNARVTLTDSSGVSRTVITGTFGYYRFDDVEAGGTYVVSLVSKRYTFDPTSRVIQVNDEIADLDFVSVATP